ncbi:hypothetical protein MJL33_30300, partial [Salmonella enterica subsp. enterica serovar Kentucky]|nr:hypothetical protein [Salmonella enterica subsp. enterica serovar Kentucky]
AVSAMTTNVVRRKENRLPALYQQLFLLMNKFPGDLPKFRLALFRTISVLLIAALVLPVLFSAGLRKEIVRRLRDVPLPLWLFAV